MAELAELAELATSTAPHMGSTVCGWVKQANIDRVSE